MSNLNIKLRGVFAGGGTETGFAIVNAGGRDQATRIGGEIVPGVTLESVHAGHVVLRARTVRSSASTSRSATASQGPSAALPRYAQATPPAGAAPSSARAVPRPRRNRPALARRLQRPEPYAPVGDVPTEPPPAPAPAPRRPSQAPAPPPALGGRGRRAGDPASVPPGSMLERIGLQPGDVVRSVNGEAVTSEADVARVLQQRGMQGSFTAEVQRGGMTVPIAVSGLR